VLGQDLLWVSELVVVVVVVVVVVDKEIGAQGHEVALQQHDDDLFLQEQN
jgi:hypothetical protein